MRFATLLGISALALWAAAGKPQPTGKQQNDTVAVEATVYADKASVKELADAAVAGSDVALRAYARGARALAAMIASVGAVCDLDLVVVENLGTIPMNLTAARAVARARAGSPSAGHASRQVRGRARRTSA